jgi:RNA polymerase sigma-70 factor (ECF subfamily)
MLIARTQHEPYAGNDAALVHSARQGCADAFGRLIERHGGLVFRVAMHITGSREDAEDIAQEAFMKAFRHLPSFEERARFSTWLVRIAVNEALMKLRGARRASMLSLDAEVEDQTPMKDTLADWRPDPEQSFKRSELKGILEDALATLPEAWKIVFLLRDVEGLSISDTAEALGLTVTNVKTRLFRARLKLREELSPYFEQSGPPMKFRASGREVVRYV